jgi:hypothetical protein
LFTSGVILDPKVFGQDRFKKGSQNENFNGQSANSSFIFCPNIMVTSKIFNIIRQNGQKIIIFGGFGVSKSVSLALLCHLNWPIHKFLHR